ncbi:hypothetical protein [Pedobacter aquatilis]|uniref:hypothetical protein n=1 Tax=Pedobacter aquatilis TaxID=351343 RepID=UPI0029317155|nr:hypothetical protein [Pedobacter aquatilis]
MKKFLLLLTFSTFWLTGYSQKLSLARLKIFTTSDVGGISDFLVERDWDYLPNNPDEVKDDAVRKLVWAFDYKPLEKYALAYLNVLHGNAFGSIVVYEINDKNIYTEIINAVKNEGATKTSSGVNDKGDIESKYETKSYKYTFITSPEQHIITVVNKEKMQGGLNDMLKSMQEKYRNQN